MATSSEMDIQASAAGTVAVILARVVVPLWFLAGAILKLVDGSPSNLPAALIKWMGGLSIDLMFVLRFGIAVELIVVGVMVLLAPLARWVGVAMLGAFLPVLVADVLLGASSCGCFGAVKINPYITLAFDFGFFLGLLILGRRERRLAVTTVLPTRSVILVGVWSLMSVAVAFAWTANGTATNAPGDIEGPVGAALPSEGYYIPQYETWLGQRFVDLEIAAWTRGLPSDLESGQQFVIFFRKDCEHCHELFELYFSGSLEWPTTAIAVPDRDGFPTENVQPFPCNECRVVELPAGIDWFVQTPVLVRLEDGIVECAAEVDSAAPECLGW